jgi:hypothetical protein
MATWAARYDTRTCDVHQPYGGWRTCGHGPRAAPVRVSSRPCMGTCAPVRACVRTCCHEHTPLYEISISRSPHQQGPLIALTCRVSARRPAHARRDQHAARGGSLAQRHLPLLCTAWRARREGRSAGSPPPPLFSGCCLSPRPPGRDPGSDPPHTPPAVVPPKAGLHACPDPQAPPAARPPGSTSGSTRMTRARATCGGRFGPASS